MHRGQPSYRAEAEARAGQQHEKQTEAAAIRGSTRVEPFAWGTPRVMRWTSCAAPARRPSARPRLTFRKLTTAAADLWYLVQWYISKHLVSGGANGVGSTCGSWRGKPDTG